uniref:Uncharacterized protein n=1 Tax=Zea mays TaxID=4577 RepID=A0A804RK27_MAIZE
MARMSALEGQQLLEDDPTVVYLTAYLLTLDAHHEVIAVEALKQAKDEHVQKLMEAYLAMDKQEHLESSQDSPPELFEPLTMKKIPAPSLEVKEEATSTPPAPSPFEELQEPVSLEEEFNPVLPSQSPPEEVINLSSLLTHPEDVSN